MNLRTSHKYRESSIFGSKDIDKRALQVQRMLANELDCYKGKGNDYVNSNIREIQKLYMAEEKKEEKETIENKEVILV